MQLLAQARCPEEAEHALDRVAAAEGRIGVAGAGARLRALRSLLRQHPSAWATVTAILREVDHARVPEDPEAGISLCRSAFDRAARISPEASVALYSLGDPGLLRAASEEIVAALRAWGLLDRNHAVAEIGCGVGRFLELLAPEVAHAIGIDISGRMIEIARRRCAGRENVRLIQSSGRDLGFLRDRSIDSVFAIDSFPYLVQCGMALVEHHVQEVARVLRDGGHFLILGFSYRDGGQDDVDVRRLAAQAGLRIVRIGTRDFARWDGLTYLLKKPERAADSD